MDDKHLTTKAIRKGYLTFEQMLECLKLQESARKDGLSLSLADILLRKGFLTPEQMQLLYADSQAMARVETPALSDTSAAIARPVSDSMQILEMLTEATAEPVTGPETPEPEPAPITLNVDFESLVARREKEIANKPTESGWTELPRAIGPFEILMKLGQGEMGIVYRVAPPGQVSPVALRVWPEAFGRDKECVERFESEKKAKLDLAHPNLVKIFEYGIVDRHYFSTSEFIEAKSLWEYVEERGALPEKDALSFALQIAHAIQAVHVVGLIHRNLKPDRVLLDEAARVRVLEPGLKRAGITVTGLSYMAPESNKGLPLDRSADLYSLGATMYFMVTGLHPFSAPSPQESLKKQLDGEAPNAKTARASLSQGTSDLIRRLMEKDKSKRPGDVARILPDLSRLLAEAPLPSPRDPASQTNRFPRLKTEAGLVPSKWKRAILKRRVVVGAIVAAVIVTLALLLMLMQ